MNRAEHFRQGHFARTAQSVSESPTLLLAYPIGTQAKNTAREAQIPGDPVADALAELGTASGFRVKLLELPVDWPEATQRDLLHRALLQALNGGRVAVGGFSLGARLLAQVSLSYPVVALALWGYPFHARGRPHIRLGLDSLLAVRAPCLIVQGERDPHGNLPVVRGFGPLPSNVAVQWVAGAKHRLSDPPMRLQIAQQLARFVSPFLVG